MLNESEEIPTYEKDKCDLCGTPDIWIRNLIFNGKQFVCIYCDDATRYYCHNCKQSNVKYSHYCG